MVDPSVTASTLTGSTATDTEPAATASPPVPALLRVCLHLLVGGLLALIVIRVLRPVTNATIPVVTAALILAVIYTIGPLWPAVRRSSTVAGVWLGLLFAAWLVLLALTPDAVYLAFPFFFLQLHLLPRPVGLGAVVLTTAAAIAGFAWHQTAFTIAMIIGPVLGAGVAVATVWGYQTLQTESEHRRRLIEQLRETRSELAAAEHQSGVFAERERLAREIHDTLAQGLSSIQLLLQAAGRTLDPERAHPNPEQAARLVEQARAAAQENLVEARRFVRALAPADLRGSTLSESLQRLCATTSERSSIPVTFHQEGPIVRLPTPVEVALLRIAQSALGNITQHSGASRAGVTMTVLDSAVSLDIVDDGTGFDLRRLDQPTEWSAGGGFGLTSMRSRAAELGGALAVESEPGLGTAIAVTFELGADPASPSAGR